MIEFEARTHASAARRAEKSTRNLEIDPRIQVFSDYHFTLCQVTSFYYLWPSVFFNRPYGIALHTFHSKCSLS